MATVSLPSKVLGRKIKKLCALFVKNVLLGILGEAITPLSAPPWLRLYSTPLQFVCWLVRLVVTFVVISRCTDSIFVTFGTDVQTHTCIMFSRVTLQSYTVYTCVSYLQLLLSRVRCRV